jgi:hypothetical protein
MPGRPQPPLVDTRALNRATLQRQWLLQRRVTTIPKAVEHLVGLQAQTANPPYLALSARLEDFEFSALTRLIEQRRIVRCALLRSTLHLVSARDLLALRPLLQPMLERGLRHSAHARQLEGIDLHELARVAHEQLAREAHTTGELGAGLARVWPGRDSTALAMAARCYLSLVHVPPAGTWGSHKNAALCPADVWLAATKPLPDADDPLGQLVLRYLAAFGPASAADITTWSGLTQLAPVLVRLGARLRRYRDAQGRTLFDVASTRLPDPDTPAPVRLLPGFDNLLLSHADRSRVIDDAYRSRVFGANGLIQPVALVDGFVRATWRVDRAKDRATLTVEPFGSLSATQRDEIDAEARRLLPAMEPDASMRELRFARARAA